MASINQLVALVGLLAAATLALDEASKPPKWWKKHQRQQQQQQLSSAAKPKTTANCQDIGRGCYKCKDPSASGSSYVRCYDQAEQSRSLRSRRQLDGSAYRFGDEHFEGPSGTGKGADHCKRVRRDSMLCMVCKDPKTNAKYEQCSYVPDRAFAAQSSQQRHKPKSEKQRRHKPPPSRKPSKSSSEEEDEESHASPQPSARKQTYHYPGYSHEAAEDDYGFSPYSSSGSGSGSQEAGSPEQLKSAASSEKGCKKVHRDGEDCTVCTDPATGAKSERCNYAFQPKDKAYAYSKSKSFGYPDSPRNNYERHSQPPSPAEAREDEDDEEQSSPEKLSAAAAAEDDEEEEEAEDDYSGGPPGSDYIRSESERISQQVGAEASNCREERRDSMLCRICKDPRSGDDLEQCSYSYEPADRHFAYRKSRHFGSPEDDYSEAPREPQESQLHPSSALFSAPPPPPSTSAQDSKASSRVDSGFQDASVRRAEIESIVEDMRLRERANCSKSFRGGMTCYSCKDQRGFRNEECVFVTEPESAPGASTTSKTTTSTTTATATTGGRSRRQSQEGSLHQQQQQQQQSHDIDYAAAEAQTRAVYDERLGLSLPAYMLERSPQEIEFDKSFLHN